MTSWYDEFFNLIFGIFLQFGPTVSREHAMGSRNTDTCIPNVACLRKKSIPTFGRSVNKAKTNIALY